MGPPRAGENTLAVRVLDPPVGDPDHIRMAHGKQGWANHVFPSPPSLYMPTAASGRASAYAATAPS